MSLRVNPATEKIVQLTAVTHIQQFGTCVWTSIGEAQRRGGQGQGELIADCLSVCFSSIQGLSFHRDLLFRSKECVFCPPVHCYRFVNTLLHSRRRLRPAWCPWMCRSSSAGFASGEPAPAGTEGAAPCR